MYYNMALSVAASLSLIPNSKLKFVDYVYKLDLKKYTKMELYISYIDVKYIYLQF